MTMNASEKRTISPILCKMGEKLYLRYERIPSVRMRGSTFFVNEGPSVVVSGKKYSVQQLI
jgi:hypothetical protein